MSEKVETFTTRMRKATRKIHSVSDALVNAKFAISLGDETVWGGGLFVFYHIFAYLEDAKERLNMPDLNKLFVHKSLHRKKSFEEDLKHYLGDDWQCAPKSPALEAYLQHLRTLEKQCPALLMAYVYHLYLGLLSGGQILAKKRRMFGGEKTSKTDTYIDKVTDFSDVNIPELKDQFRQAMNEIAEKMSEDEKQAFIDESNQVFILNNSIVKSVGGQNQVIRQVMSKVVAATLVVCIAVFSYKVYRS